ncbi:MAG: aspartate aminotransferase family protein [Epsilonproteobacteria bacterium]|nr:aspartate aminotransferase family protein [Campylobacterota bacterium]
MDYLREDKEYILHTYKREDIAFVRGNNATLYDINGKDYIDFGSGIGVVSVGHGNKILAEAICDQANKLIHTSNLYHIIPQIELAKKIVNLSGYDMRLFFANSGAEANEGAVKIARKYGESRGGKKKIITLEHSFHGRTITTIKATGQSKMQPPHFSPYPDGFVHVATIDDIYENIDDETVGVMIELVQGEGGVEPFKKEEVQDLAKFLKSKDLLLIVDEVQTGVYRSGEFLASMLYEIEPDIITLAKGLGGGVPIGAVMTRLKDIFEYGDHGSTFGGNFLSTRAANVVLDILKDEYASNRLKERIEFFNSFIENFAKEDRLFSKSVGIGLMRGLRTKEASIQEAILKESLKEGVILLKAGRNTVRFLPPLTISKNEIEEGFKRFEMALGRVGV